jgi:hypothetical protein
MKKVLHFALILFGVLAAIPPAGQIVSLLFGGEAAKRITQYGPLPEIQILPIDYITLLLASVLIAAALSELFNWRYAAQSAFLASAGLMIYYVPATYELLTDSMFFTLKLGHTYSATPRMLVFEVLSLLVSGWLSYARRP